MQSIEQTKAPYPRRLTVKEALSRFDPPIGRTTLYRLLGSQQLSAFKRGRTTLIDAGSIDTYLATLPVAAFRAPRKVV